MRNGIFGIVIVGFFDGLYWIWGFWRGFIYSSLCEIEVIFFENKKDNHIKLSFYR